jgi:hypothetical protein
MEKRAKGLTRRDMVKNVTLLGLSSTVLPLTTFANTRSRIMGDMVTAENSKPGTLEWQLQYTSFDDPITMASYPLIRCLRSSTIEGYVSKTSLLPGETIDFKVSINPSGKFLIDIYRMGYYGGSGGRHMVRLGSFTGRPQPMPMMTIERLRECNWEIATTFTIPKDWPSGIYLGKLSRDEPFGNQSYVIFVVKEHRKSDVLCQVSDNTWQAYNKWPGKDSLYDDGTPEVWYTGPNVRVSFDRPYAKYCQILDAPLSAGSGEFLLWEHPMTYWLEQQGYDVTYCSNLDLHLDPEILSLSKVFLSVGHDEYWTRKMYEEAIKARDNGLSLAFFCGDSISGELILYDSSINGVACRAFARNKKFEGEEKLMGNSAYGGGYGDWVVKNSGNWIYEGTGLKTGDRIPAMIGWEYHGPPFPDFKGLEVVAENLMYQAETKNLHSAVVYPCSKGNWVFNAGTIWWPEGLSQPPGHIPSGHNPSMRTFGVNQHVQKITSNILDRMIKDSPR